MHKFIKDKVVIIRGNVEYKCWIYAVIITIFSNEIVHFDIVDLLPLSVKSYFFVWCHSNVLTMNEPVDLAVREYHPFNLFFSILICTRCAWRELNAFVKYSAIRFVEQFKLIMRLCIWKNLWLTYNDLTALT